MKQSLELNPQFQKALQLMEEGEKNLFITGKAGTGKSTLLDYFCSRAKKKPVVLAPTGVAALNVKGLTVHSFFNFHIGITPEKIKNQKKAPKNPEIYKKLKTLVIDEVSMLRADLLDCVPLGPYKEPIFWRSADHFCR
ncbi:MAG: AAA family ATPase [Oligoflexia bacterium]|nr:AAA family ATPase [Oligoflexia bacterium]